VASSSLSLRAARHPRTKRPDRAARGITIANREQDINPRAAVITIIAVGAR